jgi:hypothetical protein
MPRSSHAGGSRYDDDACSVLSADSALDRVDQVSNRLEVRAKIQLLGSLELFPKIASPLNLQRHATPPPSTLHPLPATTPSAHAVLRPAFVLSLPCQKVTLSSKRKVLTSPLLPKFPQKINPSVTIVIKR